MTQELPEGTVTVLFTDVEGSTDLVTHRGDEAAQDGNMGSSNDRPTTSHSLTQR